VVSSLVHPQNRELEMVASSEELLLGNCFWHAIRVQPKFAKVTSTALHGKGYEEFWRPMPRYGASCDATTATTTTSMGRS
jgi:hypothetical protein